MAAHWTDFPARVEKFGDLFNILETFDHDIRANLIHSGSCVNKTDDSAYTVEFMGVAQLLPHPDRVPGWEQLATLTEREFGSEPTVYNLRTIRGRVSEVLDISIGAVNDLSILQAVEALDEDKRATSSAAATGFLLSDYRWLKVTQIAKLFDLQAGQVSKNCDAGTFVTNGNTGHDRRVDVLSVVRWVLNRLGRQEGADPKTAP